MLLNLVTYGICAVKNRRRNLSNAHPNIYTTESMFFVNGIQQSGLIVDQMNKQNNVLGQSF